MSQSDDTGVDKGFNDKITKVALSGNASKADDAGMAIDAAQLHRQVLASNGLQPDSEPFSNADSAEVDNADDSFVMSEAYAPQEFGAEEYDGQMDGVNTSELTIALDNAMSLCTIRDFIRFCVTQLRTYDIVIAQGSNDVFAEAAAIVLHTLNLEWSADEQILDCRLTEIEKSEVLHLLQRRIESRQPLSYLINLAYFCGLPFYVDERVLIPRSPMAELIRQQFYPYFEPNQLATPLNIPASANTSAVDANGSASAAFFGHGLQDKQLIAPMHILDLCTGSGCIAVALASRFVDAQIDATDIDRDALQVAYVNVEHHGLDYQINLIESDLFAKLPADEQYDLIVTNPPYVDAASMAELPPEFLYEPEHALAAGQDGLDLVHRILNDAPDYLSDDGLLVCEVGDSEWALRQAYPQIDFDWLTFALGGSGVFAIDKQALLQHRALFAESVAALDSRNG